MGRTPDVPQPVPVIDHQPKDDDFDNDDNAEGDIGVVVNEPIEEFADGEQGHETREGLSRPEDVLEFESDCGAESNDYDEVNGSIDIDDESKELYGTEEVEMFGKKVVIKGVGGWIQEMTRYIIDIFGYQATEHLHPFYEEMLNAIVEEARQVVEQAKAAGEPHPVICEIGAGTGIVSYRLAIEFPEAIILAVEVDKTEYEILQRRTREDFDIMDGRVKVPKFPPNVHPVWANAENLELPATGAHVVVQSLTYHHIRLWRKPAVQRRITAMLKRAKELNPRVNPKSIIADEHPSQTRAQTFREMKKNLSEMHGDFLVKIIEEGGKQKILLDEAINNMSKTIGNTGIATMYREGGVVALTRFVFAGPQSAHKAVLMPLLESINEIMLKIELLEILRTNESSSLTEGQEALDKAQKFLKKAYDMGITADVHDLNLTIDSAGTPQEYPTPLQWEEIAKRWIIKQACSNGLRNPAETDTSERTMSRLVRKLKERGIELPPEEVGENKTSVDDQAATAIASGQIGAGSRRIDSARYESHQSTKRGGIHVSVYTAYDPSPAEAE